MESQDILELGRIYAEGYQGHSVDLPRRNFKGQTPKLDYKNSYMPHGVANAGGADNAYAANALQPMGMENEESPAARTKLEEFCEELRDRGHEGIANELAIAIQQAFESDQ